MVEVIPTIVSDKVDDGIYCIYLDLSYIYVNWNTMNEFGCLNCRKFLSKRKRDNV